MKNVLSIKAEFWKEHPDLYWEVDSIVVEVENLQETIEDELMPAAELFRGGRPDL